MNISPDITLKKISALVFCVYIIVVSTPLLSSIIIELGLAMVWITLRLLMYRKVTVNWIAIIFIWILYELFLRAINFSSSAWGNYAIHMLYFFPIVVFSFYQDILTSKEKHRILIFFIITLFMNIIDNIYLLSKYPRYNLFLNYTDIHNGVVLSSLNIGNTMFSYMAMLFAVFCFHYVCQGKNKFIIPFVTSVIYVFMSSKTTALLIMFLGVVCIFYMELSEKIKQEQRIIGILISVLIICLAFIHAIPILANSIDNPYLQSRLTALIERDFDSEYFLRIELAKLSFNTFLNNPIMGVGYELVDPNQISLYDTGIGHHSEIIDLMGRYGIIGIIFNGCIYLGLYRFVVKLKGSEKDKHLGKILLAVILIYSFLNNSIAVETGMIVFYLIPSICNGDLNCSKKEENITSTNLLLETRYE